MQISHTVYDIALAPVAMATVLWGYKRVVYCLEEILITGAT